MLGLLPALPCLLILSLPSPGAGADDDGTVVLTTSGPIRGKRLPGGSNTVTAFLGVPYAEPPVGAWRFQKPVPHRPWSRVLEATSFGHACVQSPLTGMPIVDVWMPRMPQSEDCLFLNLWVPHPQPPEPVPVLVWIHGGGYMIGSSCVSLYDGRSLAATEKVIVASMNYRLGALGFLSLPPAAPGNAGLWDQQLALRWLWDNAAAFGGDPARLMLFGQSAGAALVGFHLLSPKSRQLIARAVLQSGAAVAPWAWVPPATAQERGRKLAQVMGCSEGNDTALVGCLQGMDLKEFPKQELLVLDHKGLFSIAFVPTLDGDFLPDIPSRMLHAGPRQPLPILTGFTANEGTFLLKFSPLGFSLENISNINQEHLLQVVRLTLPGTPENTLLALAERYSQERRDENRFLQAMDHIISDHSFVCPVAEVAGQAAEAGSPVYTYHFAHRSLHLPLPEWVGVPHGAEVPYLFGTLQVMQGANYTVPEADASLSRRLMRYWAEFARSGSPTGSGSQEEVWPLYNSTEHNFAHLATEPLRVEVTSPVQDCGFLASLLTEEPSPAAPAESPRTANHSKEKEQEDEKEN